MRTLQYKEECLSRRVVEEFQMESSLLRRKMDIQLRGLNGDDLGFYSTFFRLSLDFQKSRNDLTMKYEPLHLNLKTARRTWKKRERNFFLF